jgi:hypothetical protein
MVVGLWPETQLLIGDHVRKMAYKVQDCKFLGNGERQSTCQAPNAEIQSFSGWGA